MVINQPPLSHLSVLILYDVPNMRRAGLPTSLGEVVGEASLDGGLSAMIEAELRPARIGAKIMTARLLQKSFLGRSSRKWSRCRNGAVPNQGEHMALDANENVLLKWKLVISSTIIPSYLQYLVLSVDFICRLSEDCLEISLFHVIYIDHGE